ncbi:MAG: aldo/keto reductase [Deltaproteobacteria bacterium]|nr:aldo/keto reductase [Deltaproteobacteria bacterium]MBW2363057.1 aldo/keto reductase [Deltaproteobacteria bacterium]
MQRRRLGRSGLVVSEIGLGTMTFGSMADEAESFACLDAAFDAGVNFIDAAEIYPVPPDPATAGRSEEICGKWLAGRPRDAVIVATKVSGPTGGWFQGPVRSGNTGLDRHNIESAVEASLRRLGTDYIDLYQTHWPDAGLPIDETLEALDRLVEAGKLRAVGCSNESAYGLMKSLWVADREGTVRYATIQNNFSLLNRRFEDELAQVCRGEDVRLLAYSPIGAGVLSGKYADGAWPAGARFSFYREHSPRTQVMTERFVTPNTLAVTERVHALARDCGLAPVTFSVAWVLSRDFVGSALIGVTHRDQIGEHLAAAQAKLPNDALEAVDALSREFRYPLG